MTIYAVIDPSGRSTMQFKRYDEQPVVKPEKYLGFITVYDYAYLHGAREFMQKGQTLKLCKSPYYLGDRLVIEHLVAVDPNKEPDPFEMVSTFPLEDVLEIVLVDTNCTRSHGSRRFAYNTATGSYVHEKRTNPHHDYPSFPSP